MKRFLAIFVIAASSLAAINPESAKDHRKLFTAARNNNTAVIDEYVAKNISLNVRNRQGWTPLYMAVVQKNPAFVNRLLAEGVDIDLADYRGYTPLYRAIINNDENMVAALVEAGADATSNELFAFVDQMRNPANRAKVLRVIQQPYLKWLRSIRTGQDEYELPRDVRYEIYQQYRGNQNIPQFPLTGRRYK